MMRLRVLVCLLLLGLAAPALPLRIAVMSSPAAATALSVWSSIIVGRLGNITTSVVALDASIIVQAIGNGSIDIALMCPEAFACASARDGVTALAAARTGLGLADSAAGAALVLSSSPYYAWRDLTGVRVTSSSLTAAGGLAQWAQMAAASTPPFSAPARTAVAGTPSSALADLLDGVTDAALVPAGAWEAALAAGAVPTGALRLLGAHPAALGYPYAVSTPLLGPWVLAASPGLDLSTAESIQSALVVTPPPTVGAYFTLPGPDAPALEMLALLGLVSSSGSCPGLPTTLAGYVPCAPAATSASLAAGCLSARESCPTGQDCACGACAAAPAGAAALPSWAVGVTAGLTCGVGGLGLGLGLGLWSLFACRRRRRGGTVLPLGDPEGSCADRDAEAGEGKAGTGQAKDVGAGRHAASPPRRDAPEPQGHGLESLSHGLESSPPSRRSELVWPSPGPETPQQPGSSQPGSQQPGSPLPGSQMPGLPAPNSRRPSLAGGPGSLSSPLAAAGLTGLFQSAGVPRRRSVVSLVATPRANGADGDGGSFSKREGGPGGSQVGMSPLAGASSSMTRSVSQSMTETEASGFVSAVGLDVEGDEGDDDGAPDERIEWTPGELIGKGAYGRVYLGLNRANGELMAVKVLDFEQSEKEKKAGPPEPQRRPSLSSLATVTGRRLVRQPSGAGDDFSAAAAAARQKRRLRAWLTALEPEILLCRSLQHRHIVRYLGVQLEDPHELDAPVICIFMEYEPGGSISSMVKKFGPLDDKVAAKYARQLLLGLEYLHDAGIIHRDLKGGNVLVSRNGEIKLADFGAAVHLQQGLESVESFAESLSESLGSEPAAPGGRSIRGSVLWCAPEVLRGEGYGRTADIWSLGCTVVEMLTGEAPWTDLAVAAPSQAALVTAVLAALDSGLGVGLPADASPGAADFLASCLSPDAESRPGVAELLRHPWVAAPASDLERYSSFGGMQSSVTQPLSAETGMTPRRGASMLPLSSSALSDRGQRGSSPGRRSSAAFDGPVGLQRLGGRPSPLGMPGRSSGGVTPEGALQGVPEGLAPVRVLSAPELLLEGQSGAEYTI